MAEDLYATLGVAKTATADEIRKAYRKIAKSSHPDLNPGDKAAEERFKAAQAAYDILGDAEKRGRYDRGEIDASGQERAQQQSLAPLCRGGRGRALSQPVGLCRFRRRLGHLRRPVRPRRQARGRRRRRRGGGGAGMRMRGQDRRYHLEVDFLDAARGTTRRSTMPEGGTLDVTIPAGVQDGTVLRLKGKGGPGAAAGRPATRWSSWPSGRTSGSAGGRRHRAGAAGDARRGGAGRQGRGADHRRTVQMTVPKGSSTGDVLRLRAGASRARAAQATSASCCRSSCPSSPTPSWRRSWSAGARRTAYDPRAALRRET